jgi:glycosyltransferase involved in cell wall biosynthesis
MLSFMFMLCRFPHSKVDKPDIIIVSSPSLFPVINGHKWAKKYKAKLFFEVRDIWPLTLKEIGKLSAFNPLILLMRCFEKYAYRKSDRVISVLPNADVHFINSGMDPSKFIYIPNGMSLEEMEKTQPLDEKVLNNIPKNKFIVGYIGTLGLVNALDFFIDAAKKLITHSNIHFLLVGQGGEKEKLIQMAEGLGNVSFIDAIPKLQVQSLLQNIDLCFIGSRTNPLYRFGVSPNKLFDYMYSAKPIIYAIDSVGSLVQDANCGLSIGSDNSDALANAVLNMYNLSESGRKVLGENGKKFVLENHNYAVLAQKFNQYF